MSEDTNIDLIKTVNEKPVKNTKFITAAYNIGGIIVGLIAMFCKDIYSTVALLMYPLLGVAIIILGKGAIKLNSNEKPRIFTSIYLGILFSIMFMAFMSYDDYTFLQMDHFWLPFTLLSIIIMAVFYKASINQFIKSSKADIVFIVLMALVYGYGSTGQINCVFDSANAKIYSTIILSKNSYQGRHTSYYLTLAPWGPVQQIKQVEDEGLLYDQVKIGDTVKIDLKPGLLHIPWFIVTRY